MGPLTAEPMLAAAAMKAHPSWETISSAHNHIIWPSRSDRVGGRSEYYASCSTSAAEEQDEDSDTTMPYDLENSAAGEPFGGGRTSTYQYELKEEDNFGTTKAPRLKDEARRPCFGGGKSEYSTWPREEEDFDATVRELEDEARMICDGIDASVGDINAFRAHFLLLTDVLTSRAAQTDADQSDEPTESFEFADNVSESSFSGSEEYDSEDDQSQSECDDDNSELGIHTKAYTPSFVNLDSAEATISSTTSEETYPAPSLPENIQQLSAPRFGFNSSTDAFANQAHSVNTPKILRGPVYRCGAHGKAYHSASCSELRPVALASVEAAHAQNLRPCKKCLPPESDDDPGYGLVYCSPKGRKYHKWGCTHAGGGPLEPLTVAEAKTIRGLEACNICQAPLRGSTAASSVSREKSSPDVWSFSPKGSSNHSSASYDVFCTSSGQKYHRRECKYCRDGAMLQRLTVAEAMAKRLGACQTCNP